MKNKITAAVAFIAATGLQPVSAQTGEDINTSFVNLTPQFFVCIIAGVLLALGFQVVLTIMSVASGVSLLGNLEKSESAEVSSDTVSQKKEGAPILVKITSAAGVWTIITASVSLFFASLLAVKLSLISSNAVGITLGLVIWAAFFMLMMYLEIKSVSSLLGMVFNTALQGLRYSFGTLQKLFSRSPEEKIARVAGETVHDLGKEIRQSLGGNKLAKRIDKYVKELKPKDLDMEKIKNELLKLFKDIEIEEKIDKKDINISESHFYKIAEANHSNKKDALKWAQILVEAYGLYKLAGPVSDKISAVFGSMSSNGDGIKEKIEKYLKETGQEALSPDKLRNDFERILKEPKLAKEVLAEKVNALDRNTLVNILASRTDVKPDQINMMVDTVSGALDFVKHKISSNGTDNEDGSKTKKVVDRIENKFREYLASFEKPGLDYDQIKGDLITIFHNPKATYSALKNQLNQYDRESLIAMLSTKENITSEEAEKLVVKIEEARNFVLSKIQMIEREVSEKAEEARKLAWHEAEVIRKSAATAAWWLFATAIISGIAAAAGGMLAIS